MTAEILKFPKRYQKPKLGYRIPLYTDEEIDIVILVVNYFSTEEKSEKYTAESLRKLNVFFVKKCLDTAHKSELLSVYAKKLITKIVNSIEEVPILIGG